MTAARQATRQKDQARSILDRDFKGFKGFKGRQIKTKVSSISQQTMEW